MAEPKPTATGLERVILKPGLTVNVKLVITDVPLFTRYVMKEHAPRAHGQLAFGKTPAKCHVINAIYDEMAGWLDAPTITGLSVTNISIVPPECENKVLDDVQRIAFSDIVDILYEAYKMALADEDNERAQELKTRIRQVLISLRGVNFDGAKQQSSTAVGNSVV